MRKQQTKSETPFDEKLVEAAILLYEKEAAESETIAAYNGSMSDGGASDMRELVKAYRAGLNRHVPNFLVDSYFQAKKDSDPEYDTYQRLKVKFDDAR